MHKRFREEVQDLGIKYLLFYLFIELSSFSWLRFNEPIISQCLTFADCRLHLGLNDALVSLNFSEVSLFTVGFREWKWEI